MLSVQEPKQQVDHPLRQGVERCPVAGDARARLRRHRSLRQQRVFYSVELAGVEPDGCAGRAAFDGKPRVCLSPHLCAALRAVTRSRIGALRARSARLQRHLVGRELRLSDGRTGEPEAVTMPTRRQRASVDFSPNHRMSIYGTTQIHLSLDNVCFCCGRSYKKGLAGPPQPSPGHRGGPAKPILSRGHRQQAALAGGAPMLLAREDRAAQLGEFPQDSFEHLDAIFRARVGFLGFPVQAECFRRRRHEIRRCKQRLERRARLAE